MMKAEEYIYKHYGTHKTSQLPDSFNFDNVVDMMKHYARKKCEEQRELCYDNAVESWDSITPLKDLICNAPEPEFE